MDKGNFLHETDIDMLDAESVSPPEDFADFARRQPFVPPPDCREYMSRLVLSGGFDVPKVNGFLLDVITPVTVEDHYDEYEHYTKLAIQQMNKDNQNANFVLERIVKVCVQVSAPLTYYITFKAKNVVDGVIKTYQSKERGKIEAEIAQYGTKEVLKKILTDREPGPPCLPKENPFGINPDHPITLPTWFTEDDLNNFYTTKYEEKGFTGGLNYYRVLDLNWELTASWTNIQVKVPVKFIVGDLDMVYTTPGVKEYVHGGGFMKDVPLLDDEIVVLEGVGHFINQEKAEEVSTYIYNFIQKF